MSDLESEDLDADDLGDVVSTVKVLVVGNGHVGKSTYVRRFTRGAFDDAYRKTIGCVYAERRGFPLPALGRCVDLMVWDTAGQEEYRALNHNYYDGAGGALVLFSTTDAASLAEVAQWRQKVLDLCGDVPIAMVQTKVDCMESATVTPAAVEECARALKLRLFRSSSKSGDNVDEPFEYVATRCIRRGGGDSEQHLVHISAPHGGAAAEAAAKQQEKAKQQEQAKQQEETKQQEAAEGKAGAPEPTAAGVEAAESA